MISLYCTFKDLIVIATEMTDNENMRQCNLESNRGINFTRKVPSSFSVYYEVSLRDG